MRPADTWKDYELLDATDGNRLERWGETILIRPDPQVVWKTPKQSPLWAKADAVYHRSNQGGGEWEYKRRLPEKWKIHCGEGDDRLTLIVSPTGFKHTGVFPEQAVNWAWYQQKIRAAGRPVKVLNLFGYTGGATLACAAAGATVCHVDASKGIVAWGKDNAVASGMIYSQLIQTLYRQADRVHRGRLPVPVHLLIDEFPNISLPKDSFLSALATMRSRGIFCSIIAQNMAQLKAMYKNDWESLVGLCDEFLYLGGNE